MGILFAPASFKFVRGTRWQDEIVLMDELLAVPVNLAGIVRVIMRIRAGTNKPILLELATPLAGPGQAGGTLRVLDAATGAVGIDVDSLTTRSLPENGNRRAKYVFDAIIERTPGEFEPAMGGKVTVNPQITRPWANT